LKINRIKELLEADVLVGEMMLDNEVFFACGSDLMSDVLSRVKDQTVLLTGLTNPHVIKTAEMLDISAIIFVRSKTPTQDIINMAEQRKIILLTTHYSLYESCGKLYQAGLPG
jgi:predicted transcriptional regulator